MAALLEHKADSRQYDLPASEPVLYFVTKTYRRATSSSIKNEYNMLRGIVRSVVVYTNKNKAKKSPSEEGLSKK